MEQTKNKKLLFIVNPLSGGTGNQSLKSLINDYSELYGFKYEVYETRGEGDKDRIYALLDEFKPGTVVSAGGDGTVNLVSSLLINREITLGIIPSGSANGLAFNLNIPNNPGSALKNILQKPALAIDVLRINDDQYCVHLSDIGINARIVKRFEEEGSRGLWGYARHLFKELLASGSLFKCSIKHGDKEIRVKAEMVVIANARAFGTGAVINPQGSINDGKFEIIVFKPYPWWFVFRLIAGFLTGNFSGIKYVDILSLSNAQIDLQSPREMQIDGEVIEELSSVRIGILPGALKVHY